MYPIQSAESAFFHKFGSHPIDSQENEMPVRVNKQLAPFAVFLLIFVATMAYVVPNASAALQTSSIQLADVTDDYLEVSINVTRTYKPRSNRAAKVTITNPNPTNSVRVKFQNEDFKWIPKSKVFVSGGSSVIVKFNEREVYYSISVVTTEGHKLPFQGGSLDLTRRR